MEHFNIISNLFAIVTILLCTCPDEGRAFGVVDYKLGVDFQKYPWKREYKGEDGEIMFNPGNLTYEPDVPLLPTRGENEWDRNIMTLTSHTENNDAQFSNSKRNYGIKTPYIRVPVMVFIRPTLF